MGKMTKVQFITKVWKACNDFHPNEIDPNKFLTVGEMIWDNLGSDFVLTKDFFNRDPLIMLDIVQTTRRNDMDDKSIEVDEVEDEEAEVKVKKKVKKKIEEEDIVDEK